MRNKETEFIADFCESHKGFYNDENPEKSLLNINYSDFFTLTDSNDPPYENAHSLLCGYCHIFALALKNILGYNPYIIEGINDKNYFQYEKMFTAKQMREEKERVKILRKLKREETYFE